MAKSLKSRKAAQPIDYTSMESGQTVKDRGGVITLCPKCGKNGLKQASGSKAMVIYLHRISPLSGAADDTIRADFCFAKPNRKRVDKK